MPSLASPSPSSEIESHIRRVQNDLRRSTARVNIIDGAPASATGLIVIRGFKVEFANKILEQLYMNESSRGLATARSFRVASTKVAFFQLVTCLVSYFATGRPLLFFAAAAILQLTWSGMRPFIESNRNAFLFNLFCCTGVSCFLITDSFFDTILTTSTIRLVPYAQASVGIEIGAAMLAVMVPVATFRVQLSWFRFVVLIWAFYFLFMTLAIIPMSLATDRRKIALGVIISSILALISAFRLESLSRMFWILSASPSSITSDSTINAVVPMKTNNSNTMSALSLSLSPSNTVSPSSLLQSSAGVADSTAFPSRRGAARSFFVATSNASSLSSPSMSSSQQSIFQLQDQAHRLQSSPPPFLAQSSAAATSSISARAGYVDQHSKRSGVEGRKDGTNIDDNDDVQSSLLLLHSSGKGRVDVSNDGCTETFSKGKRKYDYDDNEDNDGVFFERIGISCLSRLDIEAFYQAGVEALNVVASQQQRRFSERFTFAYPLESFSRYLEADLVISHHRYTDNERYLNSTVRKGATQRTQTAQLTPLEMCLSIIRWIQDLNDGDYPHTSEDEMIDVATTTASRAIIDDDNDNDDDNTHDVNVALSLLAGILVATPDLHVIGLTTKNDVKADDLDEQTRLWVTSELVGNKRIPEKGVIILPPSSSSKSPIVGGTGTVAAAVGSGTGLLSERRRGSLGNVIEAVVKQSAKKYSSLSMSVSAMTAIVLKDGEVTSIKASKEVQGVTTTPITSPLNTPTSSSGATSSSTSGNNDQLIYATASSIDSSLSPTSIPILPQEAFLSPSQQSTRRRSDGNRSGGTNESIGKSSEVSSLHSSALAPLVIINNSDNSNSKLITTATESPIQQQQQQQVWYQNPQALNSSVTPSSVSPAERPLLWLESASIIDVDKVLLHRDLHIESNVVMNPNTNSNSNSSSTEVDEIDLLERLLVVTQWDFDVFRFDERVGGRSLTFISHELFTRFELFTPLVSSSSLKSSTMDTSQYRGPGVREDVFARFVTQLEREYCFDPKKPNPYHTYLHAADVVQAVGAFLVVPRLSSTLSQVDALCVLLAAMIHDFKHPGVSNNYLIKTHDQIALRYNDESVLENFHSSEGFSLLHRDGVGGKFDVLGCLSVDARRAARFLIIKLVLATDLANGAKITSAFKSRLSMAHTMGESDDDKLLVMQQMIKCADVSHPARALEMHEKWSSLISEEFYKQGDLEKSLGLLISPLCDREAHNLAKSQTGFIDYVVKPAFMAFSAFCEVETWNACLFDNLQHWKDIAASKNQVIDVTVSIEKLKQPHEKLQSQEQHGVIDDDNAFVDIPNVDDSLDLEDEEEEEEGEGGEKKRMKLNEERETNESDNSMVMVEGSAHNNNNNSKSNLVKTKSGNFAKRVSWVKVTVESKES
jgi:hypothetical protein